MFESNSFFSLMYSSAASPDLNEQDLKEIWHVARHNNADRSITGALLFGSNIFLQVLEGTEQDVRATYDIILADKRHDSVTILAMHHGTDRYFPEWTMGFIALSSRQEKQFAKDNGWSRWHFDDMTAMPLGHPAKTMETMRHALTAA